MVRNVLNRVVARAEAFFFGHRWQTLAVIGVFTADFNWTYDNTIIKGWQITPGITYFQAVAGFTPTLTAQFFEGAKSLNFYVLFNQNPPSRWQAGINYTNFFGSNQLLADRDFVGGFITRNF